MSRPLPRALYTAAQTRELDRLAIAGGIPGADLMERAGAAAFRLLREAWPEARRIVVLCGGGNNGGDGYVMARLAVEAGLQAEVHALIPPDRLKGDALTMAREAQKMGVKILQADHEADFAAADVLVDALFGTGLKGPLRDAVVPLVQAINRAPAPVLAIDIPSGLNAGTGHAGGEAVRADRTITFIGVKRGLLTGDGPALVGTLAFDDLDVPDSVFSQIPVECERTDVTGLSGLLPPRRRDAHKGSNGHVLIVGGDHGFAGAALMAARAAARCGAGLVTVATQPDHCAAIVGAQPEVMARGVTDADELAPLLERATVIVAGPGLGQSPWSRTMLGCVMKAGRSRVLDADALNLLAQGSALDATEAPQVITPHPGEAARLLGCSVGDVQADRFRAVRELSARYHATALLKGPGTLVSEAQRHIALNTSGNPGMASGGMGDVLSGVIGALMAQGLSGYDAARMGALLHGLAADRAVVREGERGLLATDLLPHLRRLVNGKGE